MTAYADRTYTSHDGLELYYREYPGPPSPRHTILCLPGLTRNSRDFEELAEHLAKTDRVLCADLRGRGRSAYAKDPMTYQPPVYVQDVNALLEHAGAEDAVFIGTSLGGLVTVLCANLIRHRVKAVIINDIGPEIDPDGLGRIQAYLTTDTAFATWEEAAAAAKTLNGHVYPDWTEAQWIIMAKKLCAVQPDGKIRTDYDKAIAVPFGQLGPAANIDLWPFFAALHGLPALAIRGEISDLLSDTIFKKMKTNCPTLQQVVVPGIGHAPYLMEPEARSAIDSLLEGLPQTRRLIQRVKNRFTSVYYFFRAVRLSRKK
jgi:pimeloyl-ACP methyl ester carboxylesterase